MPETRDNWNHKGLWVLLYLLGLLFEVGVYSVGTWWARKYSMEWYSMGPVLLGLGVAYLHLSSVIISVGFDVDQVGGATMTLLSGILAWGVTGILLLLLAFFIALAVYSTLAVPIRVVLRGLNLLRRRGGQSSHSQVARQPS